MHTTGGTGAQSVLLSARRKRIAIQLCQKLQMAWQIRSLLHSSLIPCPERGDISVSEVATS
jgi:hypothetical protein